MHALLELRNASASFADHLCFENFHARLHPGDRIGVIGPNGCGKSSLLRIIERGAAPASDSASNSAYADGLEGELTGARGLRVLRMDQFPAAPGRQSGGERVQHEFARLLRQSPDLLLLDEPGNHLDAKHRRRMLRQLRTFDGTLVIVTHDVEILRECCAKLWVFEARPAHIAARFDIRVFDGGIDAYRRESAYEKRAHETERDELRSRERKLQQDRQREIRRAAGSRRANRGESDRNLLRKMQDRGSRTAGKHGRRSANQASELKADVAAHRERDRRAREARFRFEALPPKPGGQAILSVRDGALAFGTPLFAPVSFMLQPGESLALVGENGAGKSTLLRSLSGGQTAARRTGEWYLPAPANRKDQPGGERIAWIEQFFQQLPTHGSVLEALRNIRPDWDHAQLRRHLNDALFSTNADISRPVSALSGGERARLSFACIAARPPALLLLDEINNHLDLATRAAIAEALRSYCAAGGALLIVSHDPEFLEAAGVSAELRLKAANP